MGATPPPLDAEDDLPAAWCEVVSLERRRRRLWLPPRLLVSAETSEDRRDDDLDDSSSSGDCEDDDSAAELELLLLLRLRRRRGLHLRRLVSTRRLLLVHEGAFRFRGSLGLGVRDSSTD